MKKLLYLTILILIIGSMFVVGGCKKGASAKTIVIEGSDTLVNVSQAWAQEFMEQNLNIDLTVNGGGSSVGIQGLISGNADIANASREMKPIEIKEAKKKKVIPVKTIVGYDGIVVAVNKNNKVSKLTIVQLAEIFTGKIKNWKKVGGADAPIVVMSRESSSGTYEFFKEHVLNNGNSKGEKNFASRALLLNNSSQIVGQIESNKNAIGYFGMGYASKTIKKIAIAKNKNSKYIKPTMKTVKDKTYNISRSLQIYTNRKPKGNIKKFVDFMLGDKGQKILEKAGFVTL